MNKIERYVVTVVDQGNTGDLPDCRAKVLGAFKTKAEAICCVRNDMEDVMDQMANTGMKVDFDEMAITNEDDDTVRLWNIEKVEIEL